MKRKTRKLIYSIPLSLLFVGQASAQQAAPVAAAPAAAAGGGTVWHSLGIPQTVRGLRDGLVNRRGNFPGLERKPPVLSIADPKNLDPSKPEMIQAAAKIKQDKDLKKQKIKALKFLGEVNCGCYNKDEKVEKAFLNGLEDCDPDVRKVAIESLCVAAGNCTQCRTGCETTCCTEKIVKKLEDIAHGCKDGCYKEPVEEIRRLAQALLCKCPALPCKPLDPPEELVAPEPVQPPAPKEKKPFREGVSTASPNNSGFTFALSDSRNGVLSQAAYHTTEPLEGLIANPEHLIEVRIVKYNSSIGEVVVQLPEAYGFRSGWEIVLVNGQGTCALAEVVEVGGRRLLLAIQDADNLDLKPGNALRIGAIEQ